MIREIEQRGEGALEPFKLGPEGVDIGRQVKVARQRQTFIGGHGDGPDKTYFALERHMIGQMEHTRGHQNITAIGDTVGQFERRAVIGHTIANRAVIAHVDPIHHPAQEIGCNVLNLDIVDADQTAVRAGQVDPHMGQRRRGAPHHVNAAAVARADDRAHLIDRAVFGQRDRRPRQRDARDRARPVARPRGDAHRREVPAQGFDPRAHLDIAPRFKRHIGKGTDFLGVLVFQNFQTAREILIGGHKGGIRIAIIGGGARRTIPAGPVGQTLIKGWRCQDKALGHCFVHKNPFPHAPTCKRPPAGWATRRSIVCRVMKKRAGHVAASG